MLDAAAFGLLRFRDRLAQPPQRLRLRERSGDDRIRDRACLGSLAEQALEHETRASIADGARNLDQRIPGCRLGQGRPRLRDVAQHEVDRKPVHELEGREAVARTRFREREQRKADAASGSATNAVAFSAGRGNSLRVAAVMTPSVPSEPMKRSRKS